MLARYREILSFPRVPSLVLAAFAGRLQLGTLPLGLLLYLHEQGLSIKTAGVALGALAVTTALSAPSKGMLVDRRGLASLTPVVVAHGCCYGLLLYPPVARSGLAAVIVAAGLGLTRMNISSYMRSLWQSVLPEEKQRLTASAFEGSMHPFVITVGPLIVGVLVALSSARLALIVSGLVTTIGSLLFLWHPLSARRTAGMRKQGGTGLFRGEGVFGILAAAICLGVGVGSVQVGLPLFALRHHQEASSAWLLFGLALGSFVGALVYGARHWRMPGAKQLPLLIGLQAAVTLLLLAPSTIWLMFAVCLLVGATFSPSEACLIHTVAESAPAHAVTQATSWRTSMNALGVSVGNAAIGLVGLIGLQGFFLLTVCLLVAGAVLCAKPLLQPFVPAEQS